MCHVFFDTDQSILNPFNGKRFKDEPMLLISGTRLMFSNCDNGWLVRQMQTEQIHRDLRKDFYFFIFLFNDALNTFYLRLYGVRHMVKDHSDSEKGNPLPPHRLLFQINSKGSFICTITQTG